MQILYFLLVEVINALRVGLGWVPAWQLHSVRVVFEKDPLIREDFGKSFPGKLVLPLRPICLDAVWKQRIRDHNRMQIPYVPRSVLNVSRKFWIFSV
jgi:hypothetical protein